MKAALAAFALSLGLGIAATACAEDLLAVYQDALSNDPQIREADANRRAARESKPQALAALLPLIDGNAHVSREKANDVSPISVQDPVSGSIVLLPVPQRGYTNSHGYTLELKENLFSWSNWMTLKRAGKEVAQAEANYQAAGQDLLQRTAQRYFDVLAAQDTLTAQQASLDAIGQQFNQANKRFEVGLIAITDVQEAKAARDSAAAAVIEAKRQLATAQQALRALTNKEYANLQKPVDDMLLKTPEPADMEKWVELSMNQNLALMSSRLAADIARDNVAVARGGHLPSLDLVANRDHVTTDVDTTFSLPNTGATDRNQFSTDNTDDTVSVQLSVPIFSGGLTQSRVRQSQYQWLAAKEHMTLVSRQTEQLARDAYLGVISEKSRVEALRQAVQSSDTALKATQSSYEVGTRTAVDVLLGQQSLAQARTTYARSRYDYLLNVIQLRLAAGNLDPATLSEINQWMQTPAAQ